MTKSPRSSDSSPRGLLTLGREGTLAVLQLAHGGPANISEVSGFLERMRGCVPSAELVQAVSDRYRHIGGWTPALGIAKSIAAKLQRACGLPVYAGMLKWHPLVDDVAERMATDGVRRALAVCLIPHYSVAGVGAYSRALISAAQAAGFPVDIVRDWHLAPAYLDALVERVAAVLSPAGSGLAGSRPAGGDRPVHVMFTTHSLPKAEVGADDPYTSQLRQTAELVADRLGLKDDDWTIAFQGISGRPEAWLGPTAEEVLVQQAARGTRRVVVCPFGFVLDQVEILYDIDYVLRARAGGQGVELTRTPLLNDSPPMIATLLDLTDRWRAGVRGGRRA